MSRRRVAFVSVFVLLGLALVAVDGAKAAPAGQGRDWQAMSIKGLGTSPAHRRGQASAWDTRGDRLIVFGGMVRGGDHMNDLWEFTTAAGWRELARAGAPGAPPGGFGAAAAWDSQANRFLVFGGMGSGSHLWQWTDAGGWQQVVERGLGMGAPSARFGHVAVWDTQMSRLLVFGGDAGAGVSAVNDLWEYTEANGWRMLTPRDASGSVPGPRFGHMAVWDEAGSRMLVFGGNLVGMSGFSTTFALANDLWEYSANGGWRQLTADRASGSPPARAWHSAAWDASEGRLLIFGGQDDDGYRNDTWQHTAAGGWQEIMANGSAGAPPARAVPVLAWDAKSKSLLVMGGDVEDAGESGDVWQLGGQLASSILQPRQLGEKETDPLSLKTAPSPTPMPNIPPGGWAIVDDGAFITAENAMLRVRFAYNATMQQGWFRGTGTGGGGRDGAMVELYHKPTSPTTNLIFRNGTWGSGYDALDVWEADATAVDRATFDDPDTSSNRSGRVLNKAFRQENGTLYVDFDVEFASWRLVRRYSIPASGQITISTDVSVIREGYWNYLGHRFNFAGSQFQVNNNGLLNWGGDYQQVASTYQSWTDGINRLTGEPTTDQPKYGFTDQVIRPFAQTNTVVHTHFGRQDSYTGFLIKRQGGSPSIMVVQAAKSDWQGPFSAIPRRVAQDQRSRSTDYRSYIETALFSFNWAPNNLTQVGTTWFYMTTPGISPDGNIWDKRGYWATNLGAWNETFHVIVDPSLQSQDYLPRWAQLTGNSPQ